MSDNAHTDFYRGLSAGQAIRRSTLTLKQTEIAAHRYRDSYEAVRDALLFVIGQKSTDPDTREVCRDAVRDACIGHDPTRTCSRCGMPRLCSRCGQHGTTGHGDHCTTPADARTYGQEPGR